MPMNKQADGKGKRGIEWTDWTWNPVGGCKHGCEWVMPDGKVAECYAKTVADKFRSDKFMSDGFEAHYWNPERLTEPGKLKQPARIFLDSMSDLMGHWVPDEQVNAVLKVCADNPQHTFQLLTKNAPRLTKFDFPDNVWVGVSAPPSVFMGKALSFDQQARYVHKALDVLRELEGNASVRWMSIEPLSFDIAEVMRDWRVKLGQHLPLEWAVIGAATRGATVYQPSPMWVWNLLSELSRQKPVSVFYKGNLKGNVAAKHWREEFPTAPAAKPIKQLSLFGDD